MSFRHFHNAKAARRNISQIYLNVVAVNRGLKPSYLWDAFDAEPAEIQSYIEELLVNGQITNKLSVVVMDSTIFVLRLDSVQAHLNKLLKNSKVQVIDVSKQNDLPILLSFEEKNKVLHSVVESFYHYLALGFVADDKRFGHNTANDLYNMTTLFGALLGYPVLYWYKHSGDYSETCLSMLPLKVHKIVASVKQVTFKRVELKQHELYSFSVPDMYSNDIECIVDSWAQQVLQNNADCLFTDMRIVCRTVTLPIVVL